MRISTQNNEEPCFIIFRILFKDLSCCKILI
jgi:hypothetical protein